MNVKPLFKLMVEKKASDLFFAPYAPAKIKIEGKIMPVNKLEMTPKMVKQAAIELMDDDQLDAMLATERCQLFQDLTTLFGGHTPRKRVVVELHHGRLIARELLDPRRAAHTR